MTVTAKAKTKFSSRNLNAVYKAPLAKAADNTGYHSGSRMLVLKSSNSVGGRNSILAAKSLMVAAPAPINTPSLRKENNGQDVHVNLVPTGKVGWGTSPRASNNDNSSSVEGREPRATATTGTEHSTDHFAPRGDSSRQVWSGGLASASLRQRESAPHHSDSNNRAAFSSQNRPSSGVFSGASSTGRWGDDAVEQDIARSDMIRQMQKERDFPQLKENFANEVPHHFHAHDDQRFSDNNGNSYGHEQRHQRYESYEFDRRGGGGTVHDDRFASRGYGGFDRSRAPPANAYGNNSSNHGYYHPSDSRYDNYEHPSAMSSYRQDPGSHGRYFDSYRRDHHSSDRYYAEDHHDAARFQGRPSYPIERRVCDAIPGHRNSEVPPRSEDNQSLVRGSDNQKSVPWSSEPVAEQLPSNSASHENASAIRIEELRAKDDNSSFKDATPQSVSNSVWKKVDADIVQNSGARQNSSDILHPVKSSTVHQPFTGGRPFSVRADASASASYRPSQLITPAQSAPTVAPVRILKRDGPKMLFDPKTGTMVNAEEKSCSRSQRFPSAAASSSTVGSSETETSSSSRDSAVTTETNPSTEVKAVNASSDGVKRIVHAKPDQIKKRSSLEEKASVSPTQKKEETEPTPVVSDHSQRFSSEAPVQELPSKPLRGKKTRDSDSNNSSKKAVVKSKTKKYVLAYRPVAKPASEAAATPADKETVPAPLPMKKFNELFAPSKPVEIVELSPETAATQAIKSASEKYAKKQLVKSKFAKTVKPAKVEATNEDRLEKPLPKTHKVFRKQLESSASEGSSNHSSTSSTDALRIIVESPTSTTTSGREDTPRLHHSKIRKGIDVDILKQIPEGGGVVVLTDVQEGIEFLPDDADNKFETVRSRRAVLLEKKQLREASVAVVQKSTPHPRRTGVKQQITANGIVMAAPSRSVKRTLVVGTRSNTRTPVAKLPASSPCESQPKQAPSKSPPAPSAQAVKSEQPKGNLRNRASSLPNHPQKLSSEHLKTRPDQPPPTRANTSAKKVKQSLKTAGKKRVYQELLTKKEDAGPVQVNDVPQSNQVDAAGVSWLNGEEKTRDASNKSSRKQGNKQVKPRKQAGEAKKANSPQPTPAKVNEVEVPTKAKGIHKESTAPQCRPIRRESDVSQTDQSTTRTVKPQRSSAAVLPVKMKYVPKVSTRAVSTGDVAKPKVSKPGVIRSPEEAPGTNSAKVVDGIERRNPRKVKQISKLADIKATSPALVTKVKQAKRQSPLNDSFKVPPVAPTPNTMQAPAATQTQARREKEDEAPRKVSMTARSKAQIGDVKPKPMERLPHLKKRVGVQASPPATKSYKQIYVVKSSSSSSSPAPSSSAA